MWPNARLFASEVSGEHAWELPGKAACTFKFTLHYFMWHHSVMFSVNVAVHTRTQYSVFCSSFLNFHCAIISNQFYSFNWYSCIHVCTEIIFGNTSGLLCMTTILLVIMILGAGCKAVVRVSFSSLEMCTCSYFLEFFQWRAHLWLFIFVNVGTVSNIFFFPSHGNVLPWDIQMHTSLSKLP